MIRALALMAFGALQEVNEKPEALLRFVEARQVILRADVHWSTTAPNTSLSQGEPVHCRSLIAGDEIGHVVLGTADGVAAWHEDGSPSPWGPLAQLRERDAWWYYQMQEAGVQKHEGDMASRPIFDFRSVGMASVPALDKPPGETLDVALPRAAKSLAYSQARLADGTYRVEANADDGAAKVVWRIDPRLDWNATRVEYWREDKIINECLTEYERVNGVIVPLSSLYIGPDGDVIYHVQVESIEVNDPDLPSDLTPEYIGVEPGYSVHLWTPEGTKGHTYIGDGRHDLRRNVDRMIARGELKLGEKVLMSWEGLPLPYVVPDPKQVKREIEEYRQRLAARPLDEWEAYTRDFIRRHQLDDPQRQRAIQILRQGQARRDHYLRGARAELEQLEGRLKGEPDESKESDLQRRLDERRAPVRRIFEEEFKPRLERLLTRKQQRDEQPRPANP